MENSQLFKFYLGGQQEPRKASPPKKNVKLHNFVMTDE